jgi:hypothetical protein
MLDNSIIITYQTKCITKLFQIKNEQLKTTKA